MKLLLKFSNIVVAAMLFPYVSGCGSIAFALVTPHGYRIDALREKVTEVSELSSDEQNRFQQIKIIDSTPDVEATQMGDVVGLACKLTVAFRWAWIPELNNANGLTPEDAARTQVLIKAMQTGANAIVAPNCTHKDGIDWEGDCFESWRCTAQAFIIP